MVVLAQVFLNGLMLGSIYLLMAVGFTLVFSIMRIINFAHGEFYMLGGANGSERPEQLKITFGFEGGHVGEAEISYAGPGAQSRAELAREIVFGRMAKFSGCRDQIRIDLIGVNSVHASAATRRSDTQDVRLRATLRSMDRRDAELLLEEVECLGIAGPAGGGGFRGRITPSIITHAGYINRDTVKTSFEVARA